MIADHPYAPGLSTQQRASLFYFAAAVPTVGFVHGAADRSPFESYGESALMEADPSIEPATGRKGASRWVLSPPWLS
jgi:hypothetical protein